jgi:hypothetical protein
MRHTNDHREKYETEKRNESRVVGVVDVPCMDRKERARKHGNLLRQRQTMSLTGWATGPLFSLKSQPGVEPGAFRPCHHLGRPQSLIEGAASWRRASRTAIVSRAASSSRWSSATREDSTISLCERYRIFSSLLMLPRSFVRSDRRSEYAELKG